MRSASTRRMTGQHVEAALEIPEVARQRHDSRHRCAHEIPVAVVLVVGHPIGACAEAAQVGRKDHVSRECELMGIVAGVPVDLRAFGGIVVVDAAHHRLARPVAVDREHGRSRRVTTVRDEEKRRYRHRRFGVEHDLVETVRAAVDRVQHLQLERHGWRRRTQQRREASGHTRAPWFERGGEVSERARVRVLGRGQVELPVRPVREVARP